MELRPDWADKKSHRTYRRIGAGGQPAGQSWPSDQIHQFWASCTRQAIDLTGYGHVLAVVVLLCGGTDRY